MDFFRHQAQHRQDELAECLAHRHKMKQPKMEATLSKADLEGAAEFLGAADAATYTKEAAEFEKKLDKLKQAAKKVVAGGPKKKGKLVPKAAFDTKEQLVKFLLKTSAILVPSSSLPFSKNEFSPMYSPLAFLPRRTPVRPPTRASISP